ncbi:MAG: RNA methyltransferase [Phycisphaeraceae bacterium]
MFQPKVITSAANPRVKSAVKLRRSRDRRKSGLFLAEGPREVGRAIQAGLSIEEVYWCPDLMPTGQAEHVLEGLSPEVKVFSVPESLLKMLAYRDEPEGIIAVVRQPRWSLDDLPQMTDQTLYLVAVGTAKPGNLGAMARTAEAAGCEAVLSCDPEVDTFNPNAIRASTGAVFTLPIVQVDQEQAISHLRSQGIRIVASTPAEDRAVCYTRADLAGRLAIVVGPEDTGLSEAWLDNADQCVSIPMLGHTVDSLNAANAAAILLFEAVRQRHQTT